MHHLQLRALTPRAIAMAMAIAGSAFMLAMPLAQTARAAGPSLIGGGLHISTGALIDPDGRTWVSDHNGGFCRMTVPTEDQPGTIDHPTEAGGPGPRTCLGGLMPEAAVGPDAAGAPIFIDPTPQMADSGDEVALVPDGASPSDSVWRLHWNSDSRKFEGAEEIHMTADPNEDRPRPVAVTLGSDGNVYVVFQRSDTVQRIEDPAGDSPSVSLVAATAPGGASAVAAVPGPLGPLGPPTIVVAEAGGLTQTPGSPSPNPATPRDTVPSSYVAPASAVSALAYKPGDGLQRSGTLYLGTGDSLTPDTPLDRLLRYDAPGTDFTVEADGFTMVGGLAVRPDTGAVLVLDDPALVTVGEPIGMGRLFQVGSPYARIASGPSKVEGQAAVDPSHTSDPTPDFTFTGDFSQECAVLGAGQALADADWEACGPGPYTAADAATDPASGLADGTYRFAVRSFGEDQVRGRADVRTFTVDTTAPTAKPRIASPAEGAFVSANPYFEFEPAEGEAEYGYQCKLDGAAEWTACNEGRRPLGPDGHTLVIRPVDGAGNVGTDTSVSDARAFTVGEDPTPGEEPTVNADNLSHPTSWASYARGLHIASGVIEAPDGRLWVSDHNGGFCRILDPTSKASGRIDHPQRAGQGGPRTCLGGLMPEAREGADAAGQPAFVDPTPRKLGSGDEVVLVPDGATKQRALWRAQWNPGSGRFDPLDEFLGETDPADPDRGPRPTAAATGVDPDGPAGPKQAAVYYVTKAAPWIVRINNPASAEPTTDIVGFANDGGEVRRAGESIAVGAIDGPNGEKRDVVYVGEATGVTRLIPSETDLGFAVDADFVADPVALPGIVSNAGLAYDRARDQLYVGTAEAIGPAPADVGSDSVHRYSVTNITADSATHTPVDEFGEFTMVGGLGLRADGHLLVVDDVALITDGEPIGTGRLYQVGGPVARIARGPSNADGKTALNATHTANPAPAFELAGDGALECWLRPADSTDEPAFEGCESPFTAPELDNGRYLLTVRGAAMTADNPVDPARVVPDTLGFTVDVDAPLEPALDVVRTAGVTSAAPWFTFTATGESGDGFAWRCRLNGGEEVACSPGRTFPLVAGESQLKPGDNTLEVRAIDLAGNTGDAATLEFEVDTSLPTVAFSSRGRQSGATTVFAFNASEAGAVYACGLDDDGLGPCPAGTVQPDGSGRATFQSLSEGAHSLKVRARDAHGNLGPIAEGTVIVDRTGPTVRITTPAQGATSSAVARVEWTLDPASLGQGEGTWTYACTLDGAPLVGCANPMEIGGLTDGEHTLTVTATDDVGNVGPTASRTWRASVPAAEQVAGPVTVTAATPTAGVLGASVPDVTVAALRVTPSLSVAQVRRQGIPVTVQTTAGQTTVRIQVFAVTGGPAADAASSSRAARTTRTLVATVFKRTPKAKTYRFRLNDGKLRRLKPGRYVVEVRAGTSRTRLGKAKVKAFVVRGR